MYNEICNCVKLSQFAIHWDSMFHYFKFWDFLVRAT